MRPVVALICSLWRDIKGFLEGFVRYCFSKVSSWLPISVGSLNLEVTLSSVLIACLNIQIPLYLVEAALRRASLSTFPLCIRKCGIEKVAVALSSTGRPWWKRFQGRYKIRIDVDSVCLEVSVIDLKADIDNPVWLDQDYVQILQRRLLHHGDLMYKNAAADCSYITPEYKAAHLSLPSRAQRGLIRLILRHILGLVESCEVKVSNVHIQNSRVVSSVRRSVNVPELVLDFIGAKLTLDKPAGHNTSVLKAQFLAGSVQLLSSAAQKQIGAADKMLLEKVLLAVEKIPAEVEGGLTTYGLQTVDVVVENKLRIWLADISEIVNGFRPLLSCWLGDVFLPGLEADEISKTDSKWATLRSRLSKALISARAVCVAEGSLRWRQDLMKDIYLRSLNMRDLIAMVRLAFCVKSSIRLLQTDHLQTIHRKTSRSNGSEVFFNAHNITAVR